MTASTINTAPSFNLPRTGIASVDIEARAITLQSNGTVVLGGYSYNSGSYDFSVVRLHADWSLDTGFSGDGKAVIDVGGTGRDDYAASMVVQSDGKVVQGGYSNDSSGNYHFSVIRLNADGSLDTGFSGDGKAVIDVGGSTDSATSMVVQPDGKVVLGGYSYNGGTGNDFSVVRLNADGSVDSSFSGDGKAVIDVGGNSDQATSMVVQSDGKVVLGGYSTNSGGNYDFSVVRLNADGSLDMGFSGDGKAVIDVGGSRHDFAYSVVVQSDGKVVLGGYSTNSSYTNADYSVVRLNANGSLDSSFSGDGKAVIDVGGPAINDQATEMVVQSDGKVVLGGYSYDSGRSADFSVVRLNADGSQDTGFSDDGKAVIDVGGSRDIVSSMVVQSDGKLVLGGNGGASGQGAAVRLNADGSLDTSFGAVVGGGSGNSLGGSVAYTENAAPVILDSSVQILDAELAALNSGTGNYAGASITLARAGGANAQDVFSAGSGLSVLREGSYLAVNGTTLARITTNSGGTLKLTFSSAATQALVNQALSSIAYSNTSDGPPASVQIDWTFNDGNTTGSQGAGGALGTTGHTTVNITAVNDGPPTLSTALADLRVVAGQAFSHQVPAATFTDPDGTHTLTYTVASADGTGVPPWLVFDAATRTFSGTPDALDSGLRFDVRVSARDASGTTASDVFTVQVAAPSTSGTPGNDTLSSTLGNDTLDGGMGIDTAVYIFEKSAHTITKTSTGLTVSSPQQGTDTLTGIERLAFPDVKVAFDLDGAAGTTAMLMGSLLGKASLQNKALVGTVLGMVDSGQTLAGLSQLVVNNGIAATLAGGTSNGSFAKLLLRNVLGSDSDGQLVSSITGLLDTGFFSKASLLTAAAQLDANKLHIDLVGLSQTGLEFI